MSRGPAAWHFQPVEGVIADLLPVPKALQRLPLTPDHLEPQRALVRRVLRLVYDAVVRKRQSGGLP
jgi:hypothetical protein